PQLTCDRGVLVTHARQHTLGEVRRVVVVRQLLGVVERPVAVLPRDLVGLVARRADAARVVGRHRNLLERALDDRRDALADLDFVDVAGLVSPARLRPRLRRDVVEFLVGDLVRAALFVAEAAARPRPRHPERAGRGLGDEDAVRLPYIARVDPLDDEAPGVRPLPDLDVAHSGFRADAVAAPHD